jgi:glutamate-1-semialdehyde 2,1-aminomutase
MAHSYQAAGNLFSFFFTPDYVSNYEEAKGQDSVTFAKFFHAMLANGVSLPPSAFEAWFVNGAISDLDVEKIISAARKSARMHS